MPFLFEKLDVYQKSLNLADEICDLTESFPKGRYYLADQLNRASLSIPANIAEGNGKFTKADRINFFRIARGSAFECVPLLEISRRRNLLKEDIALAFKDRLDEICRMLTGLINY